MKYLKTEALIDAKAKRPAVRFTFDISETFQPPFKSMVNQYTTFNGHSLDLCELFSGDGFYFLHARVASNASGHIVVQGLHDYIRIMIGLQHDRTYYFEGHDRFLQKPLHVQLLFHGADLPLHIEWSGPALLEYMEILVDVNTFFNLLPTGNPLKVLLVQAVEGRNHSPLLPGFGLPIDYQLKAALMELFYAPLPDEAKPLWVKSKFLALCAAITTCLVKGNTEAQKLKAPSDYAKMLEVQDILLQTWQNPPSIAMLAGRVGTNACYLKRQFKRTFGTTIYAYILQLRMEKALKLLQLKEKRISEIAHIVGYKHAAHFTTAFKKHYGVTPTAYET